MDAKLLEQRLTDGAENGRHIVLLLRGAHTLVVEEASIRSDSNAVLARFDIHGLVGIDGGEPRRGSVSVSSNDVASVFIGDPTP